MDCEQGTFLADSRCQFCANECDGCVGTATQCTSCFPPTQLVNGTCIQITVPTSCEAGLFLQEDQCVPCDASCATCEGRADYCLSCPALTPVWDGTLHVCDSCPLGLIWNGEQCVLSPSNLLPPLSVPASPSPVPQPSLSGPLVDQNTPFSDQDRPLVDQITGDWVYNLRLNSNFVGYLRGSPLLFEDHSLSITTRPGNRTWLGQYVLDIQLFDAQGQRIRSLDPPLSICVQQQQQVGPILDFLSVLIDSFILLGRVLDGRTTVPEFLQ